MMRLAGPSPLNNRLLARRMYRLGALFLPAILHTDVVLIVAGIPRMIFQAGLLILAA